METSLWELNVSKTLLLALFESSKTSYLFSDEAENIVKFESELLDLPMHLPTLSTIDMARQVQHDKLIMHSAEPPLYY